MNVYSKALIAASSKPLILSILKQGQSYGYEILQRVREISDGKLDWADGMLYPVLHRMEKEQLIISKWILSDEGRQRKYYAITELGKQALVEEEASWTSMNEVMLKLWSLNTAN